MFHSHHCYISISVVYYRRHFGLTLLSTSGMLRTRLHKSSLTSITKILLCSQKSILDLLSLWTIHIFRYIQSKYSKKLSSKHKNNRLNHTLIQTEGQVNLTMVDANLCRLVESTSSTKSDSLPSPLPNYLQTLAINVGMLRMHSLLLYQSQSSSKI